jgi:hypothetical protein
MILGAAPVVRPEEKSLLDNFLGVGPGYLKKKLDALELLLWLSVAAGISSAVATAIIVRPRSAKRA